MRREGKMCKLHLSRADMLLCPQQARGSESSSQQAQEQEQTVVAFDRRQGCESAGLNT